MGYRAKDIVDSQLERKIEWELTFYRGFWETMTSIFGS